ncbi:MAG: FAD-dependent monooxygenase, partial [Dehalococcoidia bacterium]
EGRVRLYLGYGYEDKDLLAGPDAQQKFLDAFRLSTLPGAEYLANATPVSHCHSYPNEDSWTDEPFAEGLVLVGDAAGHNDPIIGQGLSITFRDVRMVRDALLASDDWSDTAGLFAEYATERAERLRRLRFAAEISSVVDSEFGPEAEARRKAVHARRQADPTLGMATLAVMAGPENAPEFAFTPEMRAKILEG